MKEGLTRSILVSAVVIALATGSACAAKKKVTKPSKPTTHHETVGTEQLKGEYGEIGHTYTLGKSSPWNICLKSAEYSVDTLPVGDRIYYPNADQKLLVLHFKVHNPQKTEALMRYDTFSITAVDSHNNNWESVDDVGAEATKNRVDVEMKPAQKLDFYTAILVPAAGDIPKIIVKGSDELVIRYNLIGKVKGLSAPYADSNDKASASALKTVPSSVGAYFPTGQLAVKIDEMGYSNEKFDEDEDEGEGTGDDSRCYVIKLTAKNLDKSKVLMRYDTLIVNLKDSDGSDIDWNGRMLKASSNKDLDTEIDPGQEVKFRYYFKIDSGVEPKNLLLSASDDGRVYCYSVK